MIKSKIFTVEDVVLEKGLEKVLHMVNEYINSKDIQMCDIVEYHTEYRIINKTIENMECVVYSYTVILSWWYYPDYDY